MNSADPPFPSGCFLPLNNLTVDPQGQVQFCPNSTLAPVARVTDLGEARAGIQREFREGEFPDSCRRCRKKEEAGLQSSRTKAWDRAFRIYGRKEAESLARSEGGIRRLEIAFSNLCNLSCAMCSSEFSTGWRALDETAVKKGLAFRDFTSAFRNVSRASPELLSELLENADSLDQVVIKGGEPTRDQACLDFLEELSRRRKRKERISVFLQSNGTRPPRQWLKKFSGLELEIGISMDGWGKVFEWIRSASFDAVLSHLRELQDRDEVSLITLDFTLSLFNAYHMPEFFARLGELRGEYGKIRECAVFQWAQQPYASPLNLPGSDRRQLMEELEPLFAGQPGFFLHSEQLLRVLRQPRLDRSAAEQALQWMDFLNAARGFDLGALDGRIRGSLNFTQH